jgi:CubicO group peptidase (beta-lactamase class C family)
VSEQVYKIRSRWPRRLAFAAPILAAAALTGWYFAGRSADREGASTVVDEIVARWMSDGSIAGLAVGVRRGGQPLHAAGYGQADVENGLPVNAQSVFHVGSITKQFTAAAILQLEEAGALTLDDPIARHLPYGPDFAPGVTIRSLLNHTSGIKNYTTLERWWRTIGVEMTPEEVVSLFKDEPLDFAAGDRFSYSNSGYFLLGWILERASTKPYGGYLNEHFATPLDLPSTRYCDDRALVPNRARGYQWVDDELANAPYVSMSQAYAAGGVCSNVIDLLRWSRLLSGGAVVGADGYARMATPDTLNDGTPIEYGYGLAVGYRDGRRRVSHVGATLGFASFITEYPDDDLGIVVLSNTEEAPVAAIEADIARALLGIERPDLRDIPLTPEELALYSGRYDMALAEVSILPEGGALVAEIVVPGLEGRHPLVHQGNGEFYLADDSETVALFDVVDGVAEGFVLVHQGITMRGIRISGP